MPTDPVNGRFSTEPQRALLTPSASPSVGPPDRPPTKRPRLRSTPSSVLSTSNESTSSSDVNSARRASTLRVLNVWAQLAERYNRRLDEDDIIDLYSGAIIKDRGVVKAAPRDYHIGHFAQPDEDPDPDQDQEDSEQDDDENELNGAPSENTTDDDASISKTELLRGMPPLSVTTDAEDLREFLQAEKRRRELAGEDEEEEDMSSDQLSALRKALEERKEATIADETQGTVNAEHPPEREDETTPTRPSSHALLSDDGSDDELSLWLHDESTAVYPVARDESEQDVHEVEQEVIELTDSDSDSEFQAILTRPPRFTCVSPVPVLRPEEVRQPLQPPPDSEHRKSKSRMRSHSKTKSDEAMIRTESRPNSPIVRRKPEVILPQKRSSVSNGTGITISDDGQSDQEVVDRVSSVRKGKSKKNLHLAEDSRREKTPEPIEVVSRGRKRKRIASSTKSDGSLALSPEESGGNSRSYRKPMSRNSTTYTQPAGHRPNLDEDVSSHSPSECNVARPSRPPSLSSISSTFQTPQPTLTTPNFRSLESGAARPTSHTLLPDPPSPATHPYTQRHPPHSPSIFSTPNQGTLGLSHPTHSLPPLDPAQTQHAHYLLAQAMHQLSYLLSATMPPATMSPYAPYNSSPEQPWHPHTAYSTPVHPPHLHGARHTLSSSMSRTGLPPSSPVQTSVSPPPVEELRARSRGRSKSRGRRVSFKLDNDQTVSREHGTQKYRKQPLEVKREKGNGNATEGSDSLLRSKDQDSPTQIARGRTPGPPDCKKTNVSRGRSLSRR